MTKQKKKLWLQLARSSVEAEFRAMAQGICEMIWLKGVLENLGMLTNRPMSLYHDKARMVLPRIQYKMIGLNMGKLANISLRRS